jgi:hypothetical protein
VVALGVRDHHRPASPAKVVDHRGARGRPITPGVEQQTPVHGRRDLLIADVVGGSSRG